MYIYKEKKKRTLLCGRERDREREMITSFFWDFTPAAIAMSGDISYELFIFLRRPKASLNFLLVTARMVTHFFTERARFLITLLVFCFFGIVFYEWMRVGLKEVKWLCKSWASFSAPLKERGKYNSADIYNRMGPIEGTRSPSNPKTTFYQLYSHVTRPFSTYICSIT